MISSCFNTLGNTAQSPPDGFARHLLADFPSYHTKILDIRQYACGIFMQSDKKSDYASDAQSLCGIAFILL